LHAMRAMEVFSRFVSYTMRSWKRAGSTTTRAVAGLRHDIGLGNHASVPPRAGDRAGRPTGFLKRTSAVGVADVDAALSRFGKTPARPRRRTSARGRSDRLASGRQSQLVSRPANEGRNEAIEAPSPCGGFALALTGEARLSARAPSARGPGPHCGKRLGLAGARCVGLPADLS